jgi:hypothetical protein
MTKEQEQMLIGIIKHPSNLSKAQIIRCFRHKLEANGWTCQKSDRWLLKWVRWWKEINNGEYMAAIYGQRRKNERT